MVEFDSNLAPTESWEYWPDPALRSREDSFDQMNAAFRRVFGVEGPSRKWIPSASDLAEYESCRPFSMELLAARGRFTEVLIVVPQVGARVFEVTSVQSGNSQMNLVIFRDQTDTFLKSSRLLNSNGALSRLSKELDRKSAEIVALQDLLMQSSRLAALGELAGGLTHELTQPLQAIRGYAQELQDLVQSGVSEASKNQAIAAAAEVVQGVDRLAKILAGLRNFLRGTTDDFQWVDVNSSLDEAMRLCESQLRLGGIEVQRKSEGADFKVFGNPVQLQQVFVNLLCNSRDAIAATGRGFGKITVELRKDRNGAIEANIGDDGCGISRTAVERVFHPFFTTKEVGKGMGLGLSISSGIVRRLKGTIAVISDEGKGSQFKVVIPADYRNAA